MASKGFVNAQVNTLPSDLRRPLNAAFEEVLDQWRLGDSDKAINARWFRVTGTTSGTANEEFSIVHGLEIAPTLLIPVLDLNTVGSQLVTLTVSRAPDSRRIYLQSPSTGATITVYLEG